MKITLQNTSSIVSINGVLARLWEGTSDKGTACHAFILRLAVARQEDAGEFERELLETPEPASREVDQALPFTEADALETASDADIMLALLREFESMRSHGRTVPIELEGLEALQLAGLLQLTLRHPDLSEELSTTALELTAQIAEWFEPWPAASLIIRRGFDAAYDRARRGEG